MYSLIDIKEKLKNNKYPYIGALIKNNDCIYPLIIIHGNENNFINLVETHSLEIIDFTYGFDTGNIINEIFVLNMNFYENTNIINYNNKQISLTDTQLSEILFSLTDEELSILKLISIDPNKFQTNNNNNINNFDYQNIPWNELKLIINNISIHKLQQLGYQRIKQGVNNE